MYPESRAPAASTRITLPAGACRPNATDTTAPAYARPNMAQASECHSADPQRAAATGPYHRSHAARRMVAIRSPIPVTRTSLPGDAVVTMVNRWRANRLAWAPRSWADLSTAGRHVDVST